MMHNARVEDQFAEYSEEEIAELLKKAASLGFSLDKYSELEYYTIAEVDRLVNHIQ
jgi:hypothetical protein